MGKKQNPPPLVAPVSQDILSTADRIGQRAQERLRRLNERTPPAPAPSTSPLRAWLPAVLIFVVALAVRLIAYAQMRAWPLLERAELLADTRYYDMMARQVAGGDLIGNHPYFLSPLYYYALGIAYAIFGPGVATALILQCVMGALTCLLAFAIARKIFDETTGWIAGAFFALYGFFVFQNLMLLPDTLILFLNLLAAWVLIDLETRLSWRRALLGGALIGLAAVARANALLLIPAVAALIAWIHERGHASVRERRAGSAARDRRAWVRACVALAAGCVLAIAPFTIRNIVVSHELVLLTTTGGRNFYKGNGPEANGTHVFMDKDETGQGLNLYLTGKIDAHEAIADSKELTAQTWSYIARHPGRTIGLFIKKLGLFFHARELGIRDHFYFAQQYSWMLRILPVAFAWIAPVGLMGLWTALRARRGRTLAVFLLVQVASFVALFVLGRYRMVAAGILAIFAAHQLLIWARQIRVRQSRALLMSAGVLIVLLVLVNRPLSEFPRDEGFGDQYAALGIHYFEKRDCANALPADEKALASPWLEQPFLEGVRNQARYRVAFCRLQMGRTSEAQAMLTDLRERLARDPSSDPALKDAAERLASVIEKGGR